MEVRSLSIQEVKLLTPRRFDDERGWFSETYNSKTLSNFGFDFTFVQDNQSLTYDIGVIRGLHFQDPPHAQTKLLRVLRGRIFDVVVDIRKGSPGFGQFVVIELSAEDGSAILVPEGFAHGFMSLETQTEVLYKVSHFYAPEAEGGINALDPDLNIPWPLDRFGGRSTVFLSARDAAFPNLRELPLAFIYSERKMET